MGAFEIAHADDDMVDPRDPVGHRFPETVAD
jgi:hypothetical protein